MDPKIVDLLLNVGKLKSLKRTGWVREGMPDPESVAEHTFRVCLLVLVLGSKFEVDKDKLLKMAVLHDIEESVTNDPVTQRGAQDIDEHNHSKEKSIVKDLLSPAENSGELIAIWEEHLGKNGPDSSKEAGILYQFGKIATAWQALEYKLGGEDPRKLDEFWENAKVHVKEPFLVELLKGLEEKRS